MKDDDGKDGGGVDPVKNSNAARDRLVHCSFLKKRNAFLFIEGGIYIFRLNFNFGYNN